jgi:hypothetical protein
MPFHFFIMIILVLLIAPNYGLIAEDGETDREKYDLIDSGNDNESENKEQGRASRNSMGPLDNELILNEIMIFPDKGGPWIELYNGYNYSVSIDDWMITDEDGLIFHFGKLPTVPPGGYVVIHFESGESEGYFGQSQPNTLHIYTGWTNVKWTRHLVDSMLFYARYSMGYDIVSGGKPEILANRFLDGDIFYYESKIDMFMDWTRTVIDEAGATYRFVPTDIDDDGNVDIVYNQYFDAGGNSLNWIKGPVGGPANNWGGPYAIDKVVRPEGLDAGNISGDNKTDIVAGSEMDNEIYWYKCPADPTVDPWTRYDIDTDINKPGGLKLVDLDMDGDLDVIAVGSFGEEVVWYEHPADPTGNWPEHTIAKSRRARTTMDNDGIDSGSRAGSRTEFDPIGELIVKDLNYDTFPDVIVTEPKRHRLVWYISPPEPWNPFQTWTPVVIDDNISGPSGMDVGDFDNDGVEDIVAAATSGEIIWYKHPWPLQYIDKKWPRYVVDDSVHLAFYVNATDFDNDGDLDLVTADQSDGKVIWYENNFVAFEGVDQCALFEQPFPGQFDVVDFVAWGGPAGIEDDIAVNVGIWPSNAFVPMSGQLINQSLARDRFSTDSNTPNDWDSQCGIHSNAPTPGTFNYPLPINDKIKLDFNPLIFKGATNTSSNSPPEAMPYGVCFANYSSYTFSVNVINPFGYSNLVWLKMMLDPGGAGIELKWTMDDNNFSIINARDHMTLIPWACSALTDGIYSWQVNFTVLFQWSYPSESLQDLQVVSRNRRGYEADGVYNSFFRVVTSMNFTGDMIVQSRATGKTFLTNDWVTPGTELMIKGPIVIYNIQNGKYYPSDSEFDVILRDNYGNFWLDYTSAGYAVNITARIPEDSPSGVYTLTVDLVNLSSGTVPIKTRVRQLYVDAGEVEYVRASPEGTVWHTRSEISCSVRIIDELPESGVVGNTIEYRIANGSVENHQSHIFLMKVQITGSSGMHRIPPETVRPHHRPSGFRWILKV